MRIRTLVSSTALVSALFAVSMPAGQAFAQSGGVLSPSSDWAVTKVDDQPGAYCAMARRYNRDTVMTIAQNGNTETSFALDFQRPLLQTGQTMSVVLDPGAGQQRFYEVRPVSGRAFVVRLGRDDPFFNALSTTGMLRVEVAGRSYHFSLADFGAGQDKLGACVAAMVMPAAGEETEAPLSISATASPASVPVPVASGESASYRQEINALRKQIAELTQKNAEAGAPAAPAAVDSETAAQLAALRQENEDLRAKLDEAQAKFKVAEQASLEDEGDKVALEALRSENGRLQSEMAALRQKAEAASAGGRTPEVEKEIADLRIENQRLGDALMEAKTGGDLKAEMEALRAKNQALVTELEVARQKGEGDDKLAALEARNRELETSLAGKADNTKLLEDLRGRIAEMESENRTLKDEASRLAVAGTQEKDAALSEAGRKNEEKIAALQADIEALKLEGEEKDKKLLEAGQGASEAQALKQETQDLREKLAAAEGKSASAEDLQARIDVLEEENKTLKAAMAMAETESEIAAEDAKLSADSRAEVEKLTTENAALSKDLEAARAETGDVAALKRELSALQAENLELEMAASEAEAPALEEGSADDLAVLREENAQLQEKLKKKDARLAEMEKKQSALREEIRAAEEASANREAETESRTVSKRADVSKAENKPVQGDLFDSPAADEVMPAERQARAEEPAADYSAMEQAESGPEPIVLAQAETGEISQGRADVSAAEALNEAQLQEISMREKVGRAAPSSAFAAAAHAGENNQAAQSDAAPLAVRAAQDPFEKIEVSASSVAAGIPSGEQIIEKTAPAEAGTEIVPSSSSSATGAAEAYRPAVTVPDLLAQASLVQPAAVERVERASGPERLAYEWREGGVYGTAEQRPMIASASFDELVKDYLMRAQTRCPGQFAVVPDGSADGQGGRVDSYEIACVGEGVSSGASLLFFDRSGTFTVVAHEAPTQDLDVAMGYRDQVKKALSEAPVSDRVF